MKNKWNHSITCNHTIPSTFKQSLSYYIPNPFEKNKCLEVEKSFPVVNTPNYTNNFNYSSSKENLLDYFKSSVNQQHFNNPCNLFYLNEWYQSYHERSIFTPIEKDEKPLDLSFKTDSTLNESICQQHLEPDKQLPKFHKTPNESSEACCYCSTYLSDCHHFKKHNCSYQADVLKKQFSIPHENSINSSNDYSNDSTYFISNFSQKSFTSINNLTNCILSVVDQEPSTSKIEKFSIQQIINSTNPSSNKESQFIKQTRRPYTEIELSAAVKAICFGRLGTRRAASIYGIPRSTLRNKICKLNELKKIEEKRLGGKSIVLSKFLLDLIELNNEFLHSTNQNVNFKGQITKSFHNIKEIKSCSQRNCSSYLMHTINRVASIFQVNCRRSYMYKKTSNNKSKNGLEKSIQRRR
ncbi:unnamed protein product [Schistosoma turkestanicum]|nr:unnamed protein product [Schistosoma turkestanicum]